MERSCKGFLQPSSTHCFQQDSLSPVQAQFTQGFSCILLLGTTTNPNGEIVLGTSASPALWPFYVVCSQARSGIEGTFCNSSSRVQQSRTILSLPHFPPAFLLSSFAISSSLLPWWWPAITLSSLLPYFSLPPPFHLVLFISTVGYESLLFSVCTTLALVIAHDCCRVIVYNAYNHPKLFASSKVPYFIAYSQTFN